ncbi:hypothetical protein AB0J34_32625 [Nonomuraea dietziae]
MLERLMRALTIRDVFASPSLRWADPRAHLLAGAQWEAIAEDVPASLSLTDPVREHLNDKVLALDTASKQMAARLEEAGEDALVSVVTQPGGGRARLSVEKLGAQKAVARRGPSTESRRPRPRHTPRSPLLSPTTTIRDLWLR